MSIYLSLFGGMECGRIALDKMGIIPDKYYSSEIDKFAIAEVKANYPDIIHLGDITKWREWGIDWWLITMVFGGSPCFIAGTQIMTSEGYVNIESIEVGDIVLTHANKWKKVSNVGGDRNKQTINIKAQGILKTTTTHDHPYYVRNMTRQWNNEKRTSERIFSDAKWKKAGELVKGDFLSIPIIKNEINPLDICEDEAFIIGRYIADGHTRKDYRTSENRPNDRHWQLILSVGSHKVPTTIIKHSLFDHSLSVRRMVFSSKRLVKIVENECGCGAVNKKISTKLLLLPVPLLEKIIDGILSGDGSFRNDEWRLTTVSRELAQSLCLAVAKVYGVCANIEFTKRPKTTVIEGRIVNQRDTYSVSFRKEVKKQSHFYTDSDHIWSPFKGSEISDKVDVYNLEVEGDNSYVANNAVVHNCQGFSFAGKQLAFDDPRSKLFFVYIDILNHIKLMKKIYNNIKPDFMLENVKMKKESLAVITDYMGVDGVFINSALVCAQNRQRWYWANWNIEQPEDREIYLKDILEDEPGDEFYYSDKSIQYMERGNEKWMQAGNRRADRYTQNIDTEKSFTITANWHKGVPYNYFKCDRAGTPVLKSSAIVGRRINPDTGKRDDYNMSLPITQCLEVTESNKSRCISTVSKDFLVTFMNTGRYLDYPKECYRKLTVIECCRLQGVPDDYFKVSSNNQAYKMLGNGWQVDTIIHILEQRLK